MVHNLKPEKECTDVPIFFFFFFQIHTSIFFISEHFGYVWLNPTKIIWSNGSLHECLTTCEKNQYNNSTLSVDIGDLLFQFEQLNARWVCTKMKTLCTGQILI